MKKQLLLLVMMLLPMVASADDSGSCGQNVTYTFVEATGTLTITGTGAMTDYTFRSDAPWYYYGSKIKTVDIGNSVTSIGSYAFHNCSGLTSVTIPNSVTSIGERAFSGCHGLTSVTIPNSVTSIGESAFNGCSGLTSINVESENTKYDSRDNCNAIIETESNTLIAGCKNTTIPNSVTSIGCYAFDGCSGLTSITIPNSVTSIGYGAFSSCSGLTSVTIPNSVTSIGSNAFNSCSGLTSVTIPNSVTSIGSHAFYECRGLTSVTIPNSVTSIGALAFYSCRSLTSITIPNSVTAIGERAFCECRGLTSITVESGNTVYDSRGNCNAIIKTSTNELIAGCKNTIIPNSVTSIGSYAFYECYLTSVTIPNSVTSIGDYAFYGCSLTSVTIGNSVTSIGKEAFCCDYLSSVTCLAENVPTIKYAAFYTYNNHAILYVPAESVGAYQAADPWKHFKEIVAQEVDPDGNGLIDDVEISGIYYDLVIDSKKAIVKSNPNNYQGNVTIPENVKYGGITYSVTSIGSYAFRYCSGLTSVTIGNSVMYIGEYAFYYCSSLTSITIPSSVTSIGYAAFYSCSSLTSITIPNSVTSIGCYAFDGCSGLTSITIPNSVTSIGESAFAYCSGLTSINVESENTKYDSRDNCNAIIETESNTLIAGCKNTTIPNSVTSIGSNAFYGCSSLTSITIPNSVTFIGSKAFASCSSLTSVTCQTENVPTTDSDAFYSVNIGSATLLVPAGSVAAYQAAAPWSGFGQITTSAYDSGSCGENVTYTFVEATGTLTITGTGAMTDYTSSSIAPWFSYKSKIKTVDIGNSVTSIGDDAFSGCSGLTSVTIGNSVTSIGSDAFFDCTGLTSVTIPNSVTSIGSSAFQYCSRLTSVTIPNSVTSIESQTFAYCSSLTSVTIPNSVTSIGHGAFFSCYGLTSVTIPTSVTSIGSDAFCYCKGLTSVIIPSNVTSIGDEAFFGCTNLTSVSIPEGVTSIGDNAFSDCSSLTSVTVGMETPVNISSTTFSNSANATLYVPKGCKAAYEAANYWKGFKEIVEIETSADDSGTCGDNLTWTYNETTKTLTISGEGAMYNYFASDNGLPWYKYREELVSVIMESGITSIGIAAFFNCSGLTSVTIPNSVTSIGRSAFDGCSGLTSVTIPNSVTSIGSNAFSNCTGLTSVTIPNSVTSIESQTFAYCSSLTSVTIPNSVTSIGHGAFFCCIRLTSAAIPNSVTSIDNGAFCYCTRLTSAAIPNSVTSIGDNAFSDCSSLTSVTVGMETPVNISSTTFSNSANATLYVPKGCKAAYEAANYWKEFKEIVEIGSAEVEVTDVSDIDNVIYIEPIEETKGSEVVVPILMKNTADIRGFQFDLYLPNGVTVAKTSKGKFVCSLSSGRLPEDDEHTLTVSEQGDGALRFLCGSQYNETFTGSEGEIATMKLLISEDMAEGNYPIVLKKVKLSETNISNYYYTETVQTSLTVVAYTPGDISGDGEIDVTDYIGVANFIMGDIPEGFIEAAADVNKDNVIDVSDYIGVANIILYGNIYGPVPNTSRSIARMENTSSASDNLIYIEPFKADANSQATVSFKMKNTADIRGFQFDLYLPEGISMVKNGKNRIQGLLANERKPAGDQHTLTLSEQQDGAIRFLCSSMDDETFTGNDGEIATLTVSIAGDMAQGDYPILLKKMKLSETNISNCYETESRMATITINNNSATGIEQLAIGSSNETYYNLQGQRVNTPAKGVFVKNGKKVMMK